MKTKFIQIWDWLRSSFWFVPSLSTVLAIGMAQATLWYDASGKTIPKAIETWLYTGGPEGAQTLLSTIAGSLITVAGVAFSVTIVVLSLTSTQFGPRLLRNFMRDLGNQTVLGAFIATFLYCILVLRTVRLGEESGFVPHLSVTTAVVLSVFDLTLLIYFIHHVSASIQATHVITAVARDLDGVIDQLFPEALGKSASDPGMKERGAAVPNHFGGEAAAVPSERTGYLQAIENETLMALASKHNLLLRLDCRPGDFIIQGDPLAWGWPRERIDAAVAAAIDGAFILGKDRTFTQDLDFGVDQLVEIAVRALSPGINDPFTAMICIDHLGAVLCRLARRSIPSPFRFDREQVLRVIAAPVTFPQTVERAFTPIHHYGKGAPIVVMRILKILRAVGARAVREEDRAAVRLQVERIRRENNLLPESAYRAEIENECRLLLADLNGRDHRRAEKRAG